jgi:hypothetical protein
VGLHEYRGESAGTPGNLGKVASRGGTVDLHGRLAAADLVAHGKDSAPGLVGKPC